MEMTEAVAGVVAVVRRRRRGDGAPCSHVHQPQRKHNKIIKVIFEDDLKDTVLSKIYPPVLSQALWWRRVPSRQV